MLFNTLTTTLLLAGGALAQYGYGSGSSGAMTSAVSSAVSAASTSSSSAGTVSVQVVQVSDNNGSLAYSPDQITAAPGSMVQFQFHIKNHTVTQSTFNQPCEPISKVMPNVTGIKSGFMPVAVGATQLPVFTIVINDTKPIWIYCGQTNPVSHCQKGMVMAINVAPGSPNTLAAFKALAMASGNSTNTTTSSNTTTSVTTSSTAPAQQTANVASRPITGYAGLAGLFVAGLALCL